MTLEIFSLTTHESFVAIAYFICTLVIMGLIVSILRDGAHQRQLLSELQALEANLNQTQTENIDNT